MTTDAQYATGVPVLGSDGKLVGEAWGIRDGVLLVDRTSRPRVAIPVGAVGDDLGGVLILDMSADHADSEGP